MGMVEHAAVERFLDDYRAAFQRRDAAAVTSFNAFPCQVTGEADAVTVTSIASAEAWTPLVERIIGAYRLLGVERADIAELRVLALTPRLAQAAVRWVLVDGAGATVYEFDASYALADLGDGLQITAIAHNETPRLRAAVERRQSR
jgi:hypothetical protein